MSKSTPSHCQHPHNIETIFPGPLRLLQKYVGLFTFQNCFKEMENSMFYHTELIHLPDSLNSWKMINNFTKNTAYISIQQLLQKIIGQGHQVQHLLKISHMGTVHMTHSLAILNNGFYFCDCCMGVNLGIPCQHYFQVLSVVKGLRFHLAHILP
ncbi:hypothetical protein CVT25_007179 [Psilocybe cyanescens]|uniref:SWIM-type domain-containing protein n=1 Tax=Psilocybe cyanescens TaxID=93625 RepID=A0A409X6V6_PSICY|nr:hypothetical protein CVT25_007179 [Psilocybe cyanescens]